MKQDLAQYFAFNQTNNPTVMQNKQSTPHGGGGRVTPKTKQRDAEGYKTNISLQKNKYYHQISVDQ